MTILGLLTIAPHSRGRIAFRWLTASLDARGAGRGELPKSDLPKSRAGARAGRLVAT
jgi:hypothetical protein